MSSLVCVPFVIPDRMPETMLRSGPPIDVPSVADLHDVFLPEHTAVDVFIFVPLDAGS